MDTSKVMILNVNPAEATLGSLHPEAAINRLRRRMDIEGATLARRKSGGLLRALFGATSTSPASSLILLAIRIMASAGMAWFAAESLTGSNLWISIATGVISLSLLFGVATRFCMTASAAIFGIITGLSLEAGEFPIILSSIALGSIFLALAGPGRYSLDAILKRKIFRSIRRYETRKIMERRFSYKAYQYSHII